MEEGTVFALKTAKPSRGSDGHVEMAILSPFGHVKIVPSIIVLAARNKTLIDVVFFVYLYVGDPLVGSIATQYVNDREEHDKTAQEWTKRYAT